MVHYYRLIIIHRQQKMKKQVKEDLIKAKREETRHYKINCFVLLLDFTFKAYRLIGSDGKRRGNIVVKSSGTYSNSLQS